jgi:pimeloyl-ACP methyl ester carboxylesterase
MHASDGAGSVAALDLDLPSGRLHAERRGPAGSPVVLCIPGLSANLRGFDFLAERLADDHVVVAFDLRGRGQSAISPPGSYGWPNHARDVLAAADRLGAADFSVLGQSMGAFVAMELARMAPGRLTSAVFLDACGQPDPATLAPIRAAVDRLGAVYPSFDGYLALVRQLGTVRPWSANWERYFRYELVDVPGGVTARSDRAAVLEDADYGERQDPRSLWDALTMPVLLVRATQPLVGDAGFIVPEAERDAFLEAVPSATVVEVDANHYGVNTHVETAEAITGFLGRLRPSA